MRGYVEESAEVKARRALLAAALRYAAAYLLEPFARDSIEPRERDLEAAAEALHLAKNPKRAKKARL